MSTQPANASRGGSLKWAWRIIDDERAGRHVAQRQLDIAMQAIANVTGQRPTKGTQYADEERLRQMRRAA